MLIFNRLEPKVMYRVKNRYTLPYNSNHVTKGSIITVFSESLNDTLEFIQRPYIRFRNYYKYYIDRVLKFKILGQQVKIQNAPMDIWANGIGSVYPKTKVCMYPSNTQGFNTLIENGQYMNLIVNNERLMKRPYLLVAEEIFNLMIERFKFISNNFPEQQSKYLYFPVDKYVENPKMANIWVKREYMKNIGIAFLRKMIEHKDIVRNELRDWTFIFMNHNELFFVNASDFNDDIELTLKTMFKKFRSKSGAIVDESSNSEIEVEDTDDDDPSDNPVDTIESKITNKVISNAKNKVSSIDIPDKNKNEIIDKVIKNVTKTSTDKTQSKNNKVTDIKNNTQPKENAPISPIDKKEPIATKLAKTSISNKINDNNISNKKPPAIEENKIGDVEKLEKEIEKVADATIKIGINDIIIPNASPARLARIKKVQDDMLKLKLDNESIEEIQEKAKSKEISDYSMKADIINPNIKNIKFNNFERDYNKKLLNNDIVNTLLMFSKMDRPLYLIKLDKEDTSTTIDKLYTYTAVFEDENGKRHNLVFDMPKFVNDKFIHINKSDKLFINQLIPLPVTKTTNDTVQMSSNYNKIFITRFGRNISNKIVRFYKLLPNINTRYIRYETGNNLSLNSKFMTSMEYDELSMKYNLIQIKDPDILILFNQNEIRKMCAELKMKIKDDLLPFAIDFSIDKSKPELIYLDPNSDKVQYGKNDLSPIDFIISLLSQSIPNFENEFSKVSASKKTVYTRAKILNKAIPVVLILAYLDGLEPLMNRLKMNYQFTETRPILRGNDNINKGVIQFKDGYLIYDLYPFNYSLIMNGLYDIPTKEYDFLDFSGKNIYHDLFNKLFGRKNMGRELENFNQLFIDPVTEEVLNDYNLPTNFIDLMIYANSLLENNTHDLDGDLRNYRIRSNELLNAHLYKILSKAYEGYRATADTKNPKKFSIKRNALINDIFDSQILEEYSTLNPIFEIDRMRSTSFKGPGGCNVDRAFSIEKRSYNDSMVGVLAQSSPVSSNVGISRILSINPNVTSLRGYIKPGDKNKLDEIDSTNMLSGAELLVPMTATHDDPQRVAMASTQSRHTISTKDSDTPLFGYGFDKVLSKVISDRFAFKAKENGIVSEIDEKIGVMIIKYDSGATDVVDLTNRQSLNTGSGFYINNKLVPNFKVGDKVTEGDVVARNNDFFSYDQYSGDTVYKSGPLARVAVIHGSCVFEDSTIMTEEFAERMGSYVTNKRDVTLGKNSNIYHMVKIGDKINVNDPLIIFDESYEDDYLNKLLSKMNDDVKQDIIESGRTPIKSKSNGTIIDIKIYYTVPKSELSESLQKIVNDYEKLIRKRLRVFKDNNINIKDLPSLNETDSFTTPVNGKVKGVKMNDSQILIEFYIQTLDKFNGGDKCTFSTALKGINQTLIPKGQEPYLASDPSIKIDAFMSLSGYYSRMTNSFAPTMALNAVLIGAEKKIKDILEKYTNNGGCIMHPPFIIKHFKSN